MAAGRDCALSCSELIPRLRGAFFHPPPCLFGDRGAEKLSRTIKPAANLRDNRKKMSLGNLFGGVAERLVRALEIFDGALRKAPYAGSHFVDHIVIVRYQEHRAFVTLERDVQGVDGFQ